MRRQALRKRAEKSVDSYETPTHLCDAEGARWRVVHGWLQGYDAAVRDGRKHRKLIPLERRRRTRRAPQPAIA